MGIIKLEFILENGRIFRIEASKLKDLQNKEWFWNFLGLKMPKGMEEEEEPSEYEEEAENEPQPEPPQQPPMPRRMPEPRPQPQEPVTRGRYPYRQQQPPPQQQQPGPEYYDQGQQQGYGQQPPY